MIHQNFFPTMPDIVFKEWIEPLIKIKGWPFNSVEDDLQSTEWKYILGLTHTLKDWEKCKWELIDIPFKGAKFKGFTLVVVRDIIINCTKGIPTSTANLTNTNERFWACTAFYKENKTIPFPIVVIRLDDGFDIADGNHRLAAILHIGVTPGFKIPAWVANFKN